MPSFFETPCINDIPQKNRQSRCSVLFQNMEQIVAPEHGPPSPELAAGAGAVGNVGGEAAVLGAGKL